MRLGNYEVNIECLKKKEKKLKLCSRENMWKYAADISLRIGP